MKSKKQKPKLIKWKTKKLKSKKQKPKLVEWKTEKLKSKKQKTEKQKWSVASLGFRTVNKIMQKLRKRKVRKHLSFQEKCSKIVKLVTNYKATLARFFAPIKSLFHQFKTSIYSKKCCLQLLSKRKQALKFSSDIFCIETMIIYKKSWLGNREMESECKTQYDSCEQLDWFSKNCV